MPDSIPTRSAGQIINETFFNILKSVLAGDFVPRNTSGIPQAVAGALGQSAYPWLKLFLGASASGLTIEEESGAVIIKIGGVKKFKVNSTGIYTPDSFSSGSIADVLLATNPHLVWNEFTSNGSLVVPTGAQLLVYEGCGGGGGGGTSGGAGGSGAPLYSGITGISPGTYPVTIGAGGTGGGRPGNTGEVAGQNGGTTIVLGVMSLTGGYGGNTGHSGTNAGRALPARAGGTWAGNGLGDASVPISCAFPSWDLTPAGTPATGQGNALYNGGNAGAGGGGGGAGPYGAGGDGGNGAGSAGVNAAANSGAGGGGGGSSSANGGNGGSGRFRAAFL